jgi:cytochrome c-type biogenesis protein CcmH
LTLDSQGRAKRGRLPHVTRKALVLVLALLGVSFAPCVRADEQHTAPAPSAGQGDLRSYVPGAAALEGRILAPCCWNQTVDIHGSEISNAIRREIRTRLLAGESADAIQASFVDRYGQKILAMQADSPLANIAVSVLVVIGAAGIFGFFMLKRWRRVGTTKTRRKDTPDAATEAGLDARLDAELRSLDD